MSNYQVADDDYLDIFRHLIVAGAIVIGALGLVGIPLFIANSMTNSGNQVQIARIHECGSVPAGLRSACINPPLNVRAVDEANAMTECSNDDDNNAQTFDQCVASVRKSFGPNAGG